jgi:Hemerythrin HHE cation binding domain
MAFAMRSADPSITRFDGEGEPRSSHPQRRSAVIHMLQADQKRLRRAFREFARRGIEHDRPACLALVEQTCAELHVHAAIEQELLYPAARGAIADPGVIDEAEVEHASAKHLIEQLQRMHGAHPKLEATFTVLGEQVKRHIRKEQVNLFAQLAHADLDWIGLGDKINARRALLMEELLPEQPPEAEAAAAVPSAGAGQNVQ